MDDDKKEPLERLGQAELVAFETELVNQIVKDLSGGPGPAQKAPPVEIHGGTVPDDTEPRPSEPPDRPQYEKDWYHGLDRQRSLPGVPVSVMSAIGSRDAHLGGASKDETIDDLAADEPLDSPEPPRDEPIESATRPAFPEQLPLGLPPPEDELVRDYVADDRAEVFDEIVDRPPVKRVNRSETSVVSSGKQVAILPQYFEEAFELDLAPSIKNLEYLMIGALLVSCLVTMLTLFHLGGSKAFPILGHGSYVGRIHGLGEADETTGFFLESMPGDRYLFVIAKAEWGSQLLDFSNEKRVPGGIAPVVLASSNGSIKFVGEELADGRFGGSILNENGRAYAEWRLSAISDMQDGLPPITTEQTKAWHAMGAALGELGERIAALEPAIEDQQREIVRLTEFITEEEKLKKRADEKFDSIKAELESLGTVLKAKRKEAKVLERQFDVSQRVKGLGRLVSLARDSLSREAEWIEIMERSVLDEYPRDFEEEYRRALKIQEIKRQIAREKQRIDTLSKIAKISPPAPALRTREAP